MSKLEKYDNIHLKDIVRSFKIHGNASLTFPDKIHGNASLTFPDKIHGNASLTFPDKIHGECQPDIS